MAGGAVLPSFVEGEGPTLVMLGGGTEGAVALAPHARDLAAAFRVVRLQTLNVDRARQPAAWPEDYSIKLESGAMANALDALAIPAPVDIFGWSYGGLIALDFALDHPERVRAIVLFEPPVYWAAPLAELETDSAVGRMHQMGSAMDPATDATDDELVRFLEAVGIPGVKPPSLDDPAWPDWAAKRRALRCLPAISAHTDRLERLKTFPRPVLIMTGIKTVPFHRRISEILADTLPQAEHVEVTGGHSAPLTARDEMLAHLRAFLARRG